MNHKQHTIAVNAEQLDDLFKLFKDVDGVQISGISPEEVRDSFRQARKTKQGTKGLNASLRKTYR